MGILLPAGVACMLFVIYGRMYKGVALSILATFVSMQAITVLIAEITSLLNAFSLYPLIIIWGTLFVILCIKIRSSFNLSDEVKSVCEWWGELSFPAKAFLMATVFTAILVLLRAILYPPQNVDSLMYHLSRAALYYKNSTIHNFPAQYAWALYTGPLSAILMAQQMIFLHGIDVLCNLVQFPAWISASVAVYILARHLGANQNWAMLSMWIALSCPEAVLQGATTQTDLLSASCCVVTVALLTEGIKRKDNKTIWLLAGLAGGQGILSKISSGIVLFPLLLWFLVCLLKTQKNIQAKLRALVVLATSSLTMVIGFWIRNAADLEGDFLALGLSASMSGIKQPVINNLIGRVVVNIAYCMGGADRLWCEAINQVSQKIYDLLDANEISLEAITCYQAYISHDEQPYPLVMGLLLAGALIGAVLFILGRKRTELL